MSESKRDTLRVERLTMVDLGGEVEVRHDTGGSMLLLPEKQRALAAWLDPEAERGLTAARLGVGALELLLEEEQAQIRALRSGLAEACRERDQSRALLKAVAEALGFTDLDPSRHGGLPESVGSVVLEMETERKRADRAEDRACDLGVDVADLRQERDEARADVARLERERASLATALRYERGQTVAAEATEWLRASLRDGVKQALDAVTQELQHLRAEVAQFTRERDAALTDAEQAREALRYEREAADPEWDATDAAHPAWWRGHHHGASSMVRALEEARAEVATLKSAVAVARLDTDEAEQEAADLRDRLGRMPWEDDDENPRAIAAAKVAEYARGYREGVAAEQTRGAVLGLDLTAYLQRQREWSLATFGPGPRLGGVLAHIRKELAEVEAAPGDVEEWADIVILALDGAWRQGHEPHEITAALEAKAAKNRARRWPDWRTVSPDQPIEHVRDEEREHAPSVAAALDLLAGAARESEHLRREREVDASRGPRQAEDPTEGGRWRMLTAGDVRPAGYEYRERGSRQWYKADLGGEVILEGDIAHREYRAPSAPAEDRRAKAEALWAQMRTIEEPSGLLAGRGPGVPPRWMLLAPGCLPSDSTHVAPDDDEPSVGDAVKMDDAEIDEDGDITEAGERRLREWDGTDFEGVMAYLASIWRWANYCEEVRPGVWAVSTGGWSAHEAALAALEENILWWAQHYRCHRRGGHYIFAQGDAADGFEVTL